jgi:2'-5' RNA ligase
VGVEPAPSKLLRLFVALEPPDQVRRRLRSLQAELKRAAGAAADDAKWVAVENIHLTLQFLGGVAEERRGAIEAAIGEAAATASPFHLDVHGAGAFPSGRRARVVWAGVTGDVAPLTALVADLGRRLGGLGFPPEDRPFSAHLTLARSRDPRGLAGLAAALAHCGDGPATRWPVDEVTLVRSHLSPLGPRYEALARIHLGR